MAESSEIAARRRGRGRPFVKGQSGNPGGRRKEDPVVKQILKAACPEAAEELVKYIYHENPKIAMWAITEVLDRVCGKAVQSQEVRMTGELDMRAQIRAVLLERENGKGSDKPDA